MLAKNPFAIIKENAIKMANVMTIKCTYLIPKMLIKIDDKFI